MRPLHVTVACLGILALLNAGKEAGLRLNFTDSAPTGIWTIKPLAQIQRGTIVFVHPDGRKFLKPVSAVEGDTVQIRTGHPVKINGKELPNTAARPNIRPWPDGTYTVKQGEVWMFSSYNHKSYDSRYFGPVAVSTIQGEAIPLLVLGNPANVTGDPS